MKCPFRKKIIYHNVLYGNGYPAPETSYEDFEECLGEECAAYTKYRESRTIPGVKFTIKYFNNEKCTLLNNIFKHEEIKDE